MSGPGDQKMWGGRFDRPPDASFYEFERSWHFDRRLLPQELALDRAWARAIAEAGILTHEEGQQIVAALDDIELRAQSDVLRGRLHDGETAVGYRMRVARAEGDVAEVVREVARKCEALVRKAVGAYRAAVARGAER